MNKNFRAPISNLELIKNEYKTHSISFVDSDIKEIKRFEPQNISRTYTNDCIERYDQIIGIVDTLFMAYMNKKDFHTESDFISTRYNYILQKIARANNNNISATNNKFVKLNSDFEKNIITVLFSDPDLCYINYQRNLLLNELSQEEINQEMIKYFGFYSPKLILLEFYVLGYLNKVKNIKENNEIINKKQK